MNNFPETDVDSLDTTSREQVISMAQAIAERQQSGNSQHGGSKWVPSIALDGHDVVR